MKKIIAAVVTLVLVFAVTLPLHAQDAKWQKSSTRSWQGKKDNVVYWYQIDQDGKLAWTYDNEVWTLVPDNGWTDYDGKWYTIKSADLMWSSDNGVTWAKTPNRYWRGTDGVWYSFDYDWVLWTGGNGNNPPVGVVASNNPYGGTDPANSGTNNNGDQTGGTRNNAGNSTNGGSNGTGGYRNNTNTGTSNPNLPVAPK